MAILAGLKWIGALLLLLLLLLQLVLLLWVVVVLFDDVSSEGSRRWAKELWSNQGSNAVKELYS
jgi:hypothetical protein